MSDKAVIFPGQGAQSVGMGLDLAEVSPAARRIFDAADRIVGYDLSSACFHGPADRLEQTDVQQPAIFVVGAAFFEAYVERGGRREDFAFFGGLSLGEYTALYAAGAMDFETGLRLVRQRGELMQQAATSTRGGMASLIGADEATARAICDAAGGGQVLAPANLNCPGQVVISGHLEAVHGAIQVAEERGLRAVLLPVVGAFHSALMQPAAEGLSKVLAESEIHPPRGRVVRNVDADYHADPAGIRSALASQLTSPVLWQRDVERLIADGVRTFVEFGPGRVLTGLLRKISREVKGVNISSAAALNDAPAR